MDLVPLKKHSLTRAQFEQLADVPPETRIGNHTFRATGITAYLKNSGKLEVAQQIANCRLQLNRRPEMGVSPSESTI
jgi:hypothetical protein